MRAQRRAGMPVGRRRTRKLHGKAHLSLRWRIRPGHFDDQSTRLHLRVLCHLVERQHGLNAHVAFGKDRLPFGQRPRGDHLLDFFF